MFKRNKKRNKIKKQNFLFLTLKETFLRHPKVDKLFHRMQFDTKFQFLLIKKAKSKAFVMILCSFVATFFALFASLMPSLGNSYKNAQLSYITPFKSYSQYGQYDYSKIDRDDYYDKAIALPSSNQISHFYKNGIDIPALTYNQLTYSLTSATFDYNNYLKYPNYINCPKLISQGVLNGVNRVTSSYDDKNSMDEVERCAGFLTSILAGFGIEGLGGELFDAPTLDGLTFIDDYSWINYQSHSDLSNFKTYPYRSAWVVSRTFAKIISKILINGPMRYTSSGKALFEKYTTNNFTDPNLSISNCLTDILGFYSPYFISQNMSTQHKEINDEFIKVFAKIKLNHNVHYTLPKNYDWYLNYNKLNKVYLGFGLSPYDPASGDELYTTFNSTINKKNIHIRGINQNSLFWNYNSTAKTALINSDAFASENSNYMLGTGDDDANSIPVVVNRTAVEKDHFHIGQYVNGGNTRVAFPMNNLKTQWYQHTSFHIVGEVKNLGPTSFYTSREEANVLALAKPEISINNNVVTNITQHTTTTQKYIFHQPSEASNSIDHPGNIQKGGAEYGDDRGFFNSVFYQTDYNPATYGLILEANGDYSLTGSFSFQYGVNDAYVGSMVKANVNNVLEFFVIYGYSISIILLILAIVLFVLSQRIIISSNRKNMKVFKIMGYSTSHIQWLLSSVYIILGIIYIILALFLYKIIAYALISVFSYFLSFNTYIPIDNLSYYVVLPFLAIMGGFYFVFLFFSYRGIKKAKVVDRNDM